MQRRRSFLMAILALVAIFAALTAPLAMADAPAKAAPGAMASMPGMTRHDMGGAGQPCGQTCCVVCQALPAKSEPAAVLTLAVRPVEFPAPRAEPGFSALIESGTPPPRSA